MEGPHNIVLVHDWLMGMRGGEKVLEELCALYPSAQLVTLFRRPGSCSPLIEAMNIHTSPIGRLPGATRFYRHFLPLYPLAARFADTRGADLLISSSHAAAKSVPVPPGALHLCYCHAPMRYIWDAYDEYFGRGRASLPVRAAMAALRGALRRWDAVSARGVHAFAANSETVRERIRRLYGREAEVIYPPVDVEAFTCSTENAGYFLTAGALVPYKRVHLAVEACTRLGARLIVAGSGPELRRLRAVAGPTVSFAGRVTDAELRELYRGCTALLFPGVDDFGIVPVEAMASGKPVIAFAEGGALETVREGISGIFFKEPNSSSLEDAIRRFGKERFNPVDIRASTLRFSRERFRTEMAAFVQRHWALHPGDSRQNGGD